MKNLNLVGQFDLAKMAKFGVASAFLGVSLFALSGCGDNKTDAFVKEQFPNAKILSFDEASKEFGLKNKECLTKKGDFIDVVHYFIKENNETKVVRIEHRADKGISRVGHTTSVENFKAFNSHCF